MAPDLLNNSFLEEVWLLLLETKSFIKFFLSEMSHAFSGNVPAFRSILVQWIYSMYKYVRKCILFSAKTKWCTVIPMSSAKCLNTSLDSVYVCAFGLTCSSRGSDSTNALGHTTIHEREQKKLLHRHFDVDFRFECKRDARKEKENKIPAQTDACACIIQLLAHAFICSCALVL